jgi:PfaB family protein
MSERIAIVGLASLLPGVASHDEFWADLVSKRRAGREVTAAELGADPEALRGKPGECDRSYSLQGGFVTERRESGGQDEVGLARPQRWSLQVCRAALRDAGCSMRPEVLERCGVVLGHLSFPTAESNALFLPLYYGALASSAQPSLAPEVEALRAAADSLRLVPERTTAMDLPSSVVAQRLGLGAAHLTLDAACASTFYAIGLACDMLRNGRADLMLAGAVSAADPLFVAMGFSALHAYPPNGKSVPLEQSSQGLMSAEGAGAVVLKRLSDAQRDGDRVLATILGVGLSNDGRGKSLVSPSERGQMLAYERAYRAAGVSPSSIDYVECHATGTSLGDRTELSGLEQFFGDHASQLRIGAVKGNVGHLLTAAGIPSLVKVLLSMQHGQLAPTPGISDCLCSPLGALGPAQVVTELAAWREPADHARRAGLNAFGFGGCNAHLILEQGEAAAVSPRASTSAPRMTVTGMAMHFGACDDLQELNDCVYNARTLARPLPSERWKGLEGAPGWAGADSPPLGAYIEGFEFDYLQFRVPPNPEDRQSPPPLLLLKVVDHALRDAAIERGAHVAVIVGMAMDPEIHQYEARVRLGPLLAQVWQRTPRSAEERARIERCLKDAICPAAGANGSASMIGNLMASRIASHWDFTGPTLTVSADESSVCRALELAGLLLSDPTLDAVVVAGLDMAASAESMWLRARDGACDGADFRLSLEQASRGFGVGEGAGAIVVRRADDDLPAGQAWATIESLAFRNGSRGEAIAAAAREAFAAAAVEPSTAGYLELNACGQLERDDQELSALGSVYRTATPMQCAIGSVKAVAGNTFAASGIASLIHTVLCLSQRYLPSPPNWTRARRRGNAESGPFYVAPCARAWIPAIPETPRIAGISNIAAYASCHVVLKEACGPRARAARSSLRWLGLFPLTFTQREGLAAALTALEQRAQDGLCCASLARACQAEYRPGAQGTHTAVIVAESMLQLREEIRRLREAVSGKADWTELSTPAGSYVTLAALGEQHGITAVFPGAFNAYFDAGHELFGLFPETFAWLQHSGARTASCFNDPLVSPRSLDRLDSAQTEARMRIAMAQPAAAFEHGILLSILYSEIFRNVFGVQPTAACGFSMGEISMLYALGVWSTTDTMSARLRASPVFRSELAGSMNTLRRAWNLTPDQVPDGELWRGYIVHAPRALVDEAIAQEPFVRVILINSQRSLVIAGYPPACRRVIERLGCDAIETPLGDVIHCDLVWPQRAALAELHRIPAQPEPQPQVRLFTAAGYRELAVASTDLADNIAEIYCHPVDFPRLIETAYAAGSRIFLELGPRDSCTRSISEILAGRPHIAIASDRKGLGARRSLLQALAKLLAQRVPLDLQRFAEQPAKDLAPARKLSGTVRLGGARFAPQVAGLVVSSRAITAPPPAPTSTELECVQAPVAAVLVQSNSAVHVPQRAHALHGALDQLQTLHLQLIASQAGFVERRHAALRKAADVMLTHAAAAGTTSARVAVSRAPTASRPLPVSRPTPPPLVATPVPRAARSRWDHVQRSVRSDRSREVVWDLHDLRMFAEGDIADVFGPQFATIEAYRRRVRLPTSEYLLVSRVTELDATPRRFVQSRITTEYDIPHDAWYLCNGQVPWAVVVEAGQCDLLLISYLGIDFENRGERVYRLLDCTLTFLEALHDGPQTLRYEISIDSFARQGTTTLFFFHYECFAGDRLVLKMDGGAAGFFSDEELAKGRGVIRSQAEEQTRARVVKSSFEPLSPCDKRSFTDRDMQSLCSGDLASCFGRSPTSLAANPRLAFSAPKMLMIDRVPQVDPHGGAWGLGLVIGEKTLAPDHWYFPCHFKDDPVMAGSLMAEGCSQLLRFYALYLGLHQAVQGARFLPLPNLPQRVRCRGQVTPQDGVLVYRMEVTELGVHPRVYAKANVEVLLNGVVIVEFQNLGLYLDGEAVPRSGLSWPAHVADLDLPIDQIKIPTYTPGLYPVRKPPLRPFPGNPLDTNCIPNQFPYTWYHFTEFATGRVANCFGEVCSGYDARTPPRTPNSDLQLVTRVLSAEGKRLDLSKGGATCVSELDCPADAWFFTQNNHPSFMPYSIMMEIALQPCGFLSAWMGTTLLVPDIDLFFRNLDGSGELLQLPDCRNKTIRNCVTLRSTSRVGNTIVQSFQYELSVEGEVFYRGDAVFGYFERAALEQQLGLRGERLSAPPESLSARSARLLVRIAAERARLGRGTHCALPTQQLSFLDFVDVIANGGKCGLGYLYAERKIDANEWFFHCHFHQDPVMPGSLGLQAMFEMLHVFALEQDLGAELVQPRFAHVLGTTRWRYRGQITPNNEKMSVAIHITGIERTNDRVVIVADGLLAKDGLLIYETQDLRLCIEHALD